MKTVNLIMLVFCTIVFMGLPFVSNKIPYANRIECEIVSGVWMLLFKIQTVRDEITKKD